MLRRRLGDIVDLMLAMSVGQLLGRHVLNFGEYEGCQRGCLGRGGGGAFCENGGVMGDASAAERLSAASEFEEKWSHR